MARKKITTDAHHKTKKQPQPQDIVDVPPAADSDASAKLETLRSLNKRLLSEEYSRRQQVDSLLQTKGSLEDELVLAKSQADGFNSELAQMGEDFVGLDIQKTVFSAFITAQIGLQGALIERRMNMLESEARDLKRVCDEKEKSTGRLSERLNEIEVSLRNEKEAVGMAIAERDRLKMTLLSKTEEVEKLRANLSSLEGTNMEVQREIEGLQLAHDTAARLKDEGEVRIASLTRERDSLVGSLREAGKLIEELKEEISRAVEERRRIEEMKDLEMLKAQDLEKSIGELNDVVVKMLKQEGVLLSNVADLERKCRESDVKMKEMEREIDQLGEERKLSEERAKQLYEEKTKTEVHLGKALEQLDSEKSKAEKLAHEKCALFVENGGLAADVSKLSSQVAELKAVVSKLQECSEAVGERIRGLESLIEEYKCKLEDLKSEKNVLETHLDGEQVNVMEMRKKIGELEIEIEKSILAAVEAKAARDAIISENEELKMQSETLKTKLSFLEKLLNVARNEKASMKGKFEMAEARTEVILNMLKQTAAFCKKEGSGRDGVDLQFEVKSEEVKKFAVEMKTIMDAFRDEETKVENIDHQLESLKRCSEENKRKTNRLWAVLSSATSVLAAGTVAYAARRFAF